MNEIYFKLNTNKKLLPVPTNQKVNAYLKELADICGIETKITFHIARQHGTGKPPEHQTATWKGHQSFPALKGR